MNAIILAGGLGSRLRSVIGHEIPKPMADVGGRPFLSYLLDFLIGKKIQSVCLSVGYKSNSIIEYFGGGYNGLNITYSIEDLPLGTGGAINRAFDVSSFSEAFVFNGDSILGFDDDLLSIGFERPSMICRTVPDVSRYGAVIVENEAIVGFSEKGIIGSGVINAGIYGLSRDFLNKYSMPSVFSFESDFISREEVFSRFVPHIFDGYFIDIGIPADYERACSELPLVFG